MQFEGTPEDEAEGEAHIFTVTDIEEGKVVLMAIIRWQVWHCALR
jgi:hypothetical protein